MKIARVFVGQYPGREIGEIHDVFSPEQHPGMILYGIIKEVEVADDFDKEIMKGVVAEDGSISFEEDSAKVAAKELAEKQKQIADRYKDMNDDVYAMMSLVFGTSNPDSATAHHQTWMLMKQKPVLFFDKGLKAHVGHGSVQVGDALDTVQKVEDYATAALEAVEQYAVERLARIKQFQEEKAAIEGV